jgi:GxxExxY protein
MGPGLLESAYQKCMEFELKKQELAIECERASPIIYATVKIEDRHAGAGCVIVENKTSDNKLYSRVDARK